MDDDRGSGSGLSIWRRLVGPRPWELLVETLENEREHLRVRNDRLTEALLSMKKEGYQYQGPAITDSEPAITLPEDVLAAIYETSGGNRELENEQAVYAQSLLDGEMPTALVAEAIRDGADMEMVNE